MKFTFALLLTAWLSMAATPPDLKNDFARPPAEARPGAFWLWMNGQVSREGITADLEAMKHYGINTPMQISIGIGVPEGPVGFGTEAHFEMLEHAAREAERLGLQIALHNADSWSGSGGPWITPELSMQTLTWTDLRVAGPGPVTACLPLPEHQMDYYRDLAVFAVACPPDAGTADSMEGARLRSNREIADAEALLRPYPATSTGAPQPVQIGRDPVWFEIELQEPATIRSLEIRGPGGQFPDCRILAQDASGEWVLLRETEAEFWAFGGSNHEVFRLPPTRTQRLRVELSGTHRFALGGLRASDLDPIEDWPGKGGYVGFCEFDPAALLDPETDAAPEIIDLTEALGPDGSLDWEAPPGVWRIVRLGHTTTGRHNAPATRLGYGLECDKMSKEALEHHFDAYLAECIERFGDVAGSTVAWSLVDSWEVGTQNWTPRLPEEFRERRGYAMEPFLPVFAGAVVGSRAESERFLWDFRLTVSELVADHYYGHHARLAREHGMRFAAEPYTVGASSMGFDQLLAATTVDMPMTEFWTGRFDHVPIPEEQILLPNHFHETRQMTSAAHVAGNPIIGAEAFTAGASQGRWTNHPWGLKRQGDRMFCHGVNRFFLHRWAHQPWPWLEPGMTQERWGPHFESSNTWFEPGESWFDYLARCQTLLQAGRFVADVAYYPGDHGPHLQKRLDEVDATIPPGYDWDAVPGNFLLQASVEDGAIVLPSGMRYRLLILNELPLLTATIATKIRELVEDGATVLGPRPIASPSLSDSPVADATVTAVAAELWGPGEQGSRKTGAGTVYWGLSPQEVLAAIGVEADCLTSQENSSPMDKNWIHRRVGDTDSYLLRNLLEEPTELQVSLRAAGRQPELWWPDTGRIEPAPLWHSNAGRTDLTIALPPLGSVFVVFREKATETVPFASLRAANGLAGSKPRLEGLPDGLRIISAEGGGYLLTDAIGRETLVEIAPPPSARALTGPWNLSFPEGRGAPDSVVIPELISWSEHEDFGVRHFSGTATYRLSFELPDAWPLDEPGLRYELDLGEVRHLASARLNGVDLGALWKPPFRFDIGSALRPGTNTLEVDITNLWVNRLIGDAHLPEDADWSQNGEGPTLETIPAWIENRSPRPSGRIAFSTFRHWTKDDPLLPSGLLGPVTLRPLRSVEMEQVPPPATLNEI